MSVDLEFDAVVIGAGFAGLYALLKLRDELGLRVRAFEAGEGVGGTWYWNRYPGARCDTESHYYCYSFSRELADEWEWSSRYAEQPEVERYLNHVADRFALRADIELSTRVMEAEFDDAADRWIIRTATGRSVSARCLISAVGCLSAPHVPELPGADEFDGQTYLTAQWPREPVAFNGLRVNVIGTGSSGIQVVPRIAETAAQLTVFQRTPNFSVPARQRPLKSEDRELFRRDYERTRTQIHHSFAGYPFDPIRRRTSSVPLSERLEIFEELWAAGGLRFFLGGFIDMMSDPEANEFASEFIRNKIREVVDDPATAEILCPSDHRYGAKRPPIDTDYYSTFNRDNVHLVDVHEEPIEAITAGGVRTAKREYGCDVIVLATGFDAVTGALLRIDVRGLDGTRLADAWAEGARAFLGLQVAGFPNLFIITGPGSPSITMNVPVAIEYHVEWIAECLTYMRGHAYTRAEATEDAQQSWADYVAELGQRSLFTTTSSYQTGANIPGKPNAVLPFTGGQVKYREQCEAVKNDGYRGFVFSSSDTRT
jgi:cation diffusion facilitator CzcD-associated flavoprotein CzcO